MIYCKHIEVDRISVFIAICHVPHNKPGPVLWWRQGLGTVIKEINVLCPVLDGEAISDCSLTCMPV